MSLASRMTHDVTVYTHSDSTADIYGDATDAWSVGTSYKGWVTPQATNETLEDRDTRISTYLVLLPEFAVVDALDELEWEGNRMQIVGKPRESPYRNGVHHIELEAELIEG